MDYCCKNARSPARPHQPQGDGEILFRNRRAEFVYLEDIKMQRRRGGTRSRRSWRRSSFRPERLERSRWGSTKIDPDDLITIIYTSRLHRRPQRRDADAQQHRGSNLEAFASAVDIRDDDVLVGVLPPFHSFGYTVTMWDVLTMGAQGSLSLLALWRPRADRQAGDENTEATTPYRDARPFSERTLKRCEKEDFATTDLVVGGAEKLPMSLADAFRSQVRPSPRRRLWNDRIFAGRFRQYSRRAARSRA